MRGRLDAVLIAARVAPLTRHIGLIPTVVVTHTEPFHASKAIATLDYVSSGRAGRAGAGLGPPDEAAPFGRRAFPRLGGTRRPADTADPRALRRGRRLRRGGAAALGQLGGRRGDPRRRHRPVRRPRQAALHRLRGRLLQREGAVDHPAAAAGPADRQRAGAPHASPTGWSARGRRRLRDPARRRPRRAIVAEIRPRRRRRAGPETGARLRRPASCSWTPHRRGGRPQGPARRAGWAANTSATRPSSPARRPAGRSAAGLAAGGLSGFRLRPAAIPTISRRSPGAWCPNCSAAARSARSYAPGPCAGCSAWPARPATRTPITGRRRP